MLKSAETNPCSSCRIQLPDEVEERKSACCQQSILTMSPHCFDTYFRQADVKHVGVYEDNFWGPQVRVEFHDSCTHLNGDGRCDIEVRTGDKTKKLRVCQEVQPKKSNFCAKSPGGRFAEFLIQSVLWIGDQADNDQEVEGKGTV